MILKTGSKWVEAIRLASIKDRHDLIWKQPIIIWFNKNRKEIRRLTKVAPRLADDAWVIHGWSAQDGREGLSLSPSNLDYALRFLAPENGWVLCEFENEIEFYTEALRYLQEK